LLTAITSVLATNNPERTSIGAEQIIGSCPPIEAPGSPQSN
jgi:hypothetical protein